MELLNRAMDAIEKDPGSPVDVPALARVALTSEHHFRRMFSALAGIPLSEYVRRRRLTVAAAAVVDGVEAVQDIAVRHGYGSADAFSRAFKAFHGIGPEQARRPGAVLRAQPRLTFHLRIEGSSDMQYRIVKKDAFRIAGLRTRIPLIYEGVNPVGAEFNRTITDAQWERLETLSDQEPRGALTVLDGIDESRAEGSMLDYYVAATTSQPVPPDLEGLEIAAGTWVVFSATGPFPTALQVLWPKAYGEWFPANPYRTAPGPELVRSEYHNDAGTTADFELWLPVEATG